MKATTVEHATLQIIAGTVHNTVSNFLIERRSRGLSKSTIWFYTRYLNEFCQYLDSIGDINLDELTADIIRKYLLHLEGQGHNSGGVHGYYRCIRAMLSWWEEESDGDYQSPMRKVKPPKVQIKPLPVAWGCHHGYSKKW